MNPKRPSHLTELAEACLQALAAQGLGHKISLGGALGLLHYLDYRTTHDVDAWWEPSASGADQAEVERVVESVLRSHGMFRRRAWGDVVSLELRQQDRTVFSFQIAHRSARLDPPTEAPWVELSLDSFADLVASKMEALVERGAPRDFRDVHAVCRAGLVSAGECWRWWRRRQQLAGSDADGHRARLAVETHLERIARHRPLEEIEDPDRRAEAESVRRWFAEELLHADLD